MLCQLSCMHDFTNDLTTQHPPPSLSSPVHGMPQGVPAQASCPCPAHFACGCQPACLALLMSVVKGSALVQLLAHYC